MQALLSLAHKYETKDLLARLQPVLKDFFNTDCVCDFLRLAHLFGLKQLVTDCHEWIFQTSKEKVRRGRPPVSTFRLTASDEYYDLVRKSDSFKTLPRDAVVDLLDYSAECARARKLVPDPAEGRKVVLLPKRQFARLVGTSDSDSSSDSD